ncbi:hypothetical protein GW17_00061831 [Ensete ventricosum]|nr:hypothetical protein GW17_00061831 [Ensete ventricosum]
MHPLRFPNSGGIKAKVFVRKLWLWESIEERGRLAMARPSTRAVDHSHTPCRGDRPWPDHGQPPCRGDRLRPRLRGQPLAKGGFAARGQATRSGCPQRAHKGLPPAGVATPAARVAAPWQGGCRSQGVVVACVGAATTTTQRGKRRT